MLAAVTTLRYITESYSIQISERKKMHFYCDNKSVVKTVNSRMEFQRTVDKHRYPDANIELQLIYKLNALQKTKRIIEISHVKGHQGSTTRQNLTNEEKLNVEADDLTHIARKLPDIKTYHKSQLIKQTFV
jgi:ribonuclease HI